MVLKNSKKKKSICFVHYGIGWKDGVNTVLTNLTAEIKEMEPSLRVCFLGGETERRILKGAKYKVVPELIPKKITKRITKKELKKEASIIARKLSEETKGIDVVVIENPLLGTYHLPAMLGFSLYASKHKPKGAKIFFRVHDLYSDSPQYFKNLEKLCSPKEIKEIVKGKGVDGFLVIDPVIRTNLIKAGVARKKIYYVPNGVDRDLFKRKLNKTEKENVLAKLEIPVKYRKGAKILVYPVRVVPRKNIGEAIVLIYYIRYITRNNYVLVISGKVDENDRLSKGYYDALQKLIELAELPVIFIKQGFSLKRKYGPRGKVRDFSVADLYQVCSGVIMTSLREGFGYPFLETWFARKIIIGRRTPNVITNFERSGFNFNWLYRNFLIAEKISRKKEKETYLDEINKRFRWLYQIFLLPEKFFLMPRKVEHLERVKKFINVLKKPELEKETLKLNRPAVMKQIRVLENKKRQRKIIKHNFKIARKFYESKKTAKQFLEVVGLE